jgi:AraC-like DNA-binding protein
MRVPTHYLNGFISFAEAHGASRQELLKEAAVSQETLDDPDARIEYAQFKLLIQRAVARSGSPALGIRLAAQLPITTHGLLGYAAMSSGTLEEALSFVTRFVPTRIPVLVAELSVDKGVATLRLEEAAVLGEVRATILEATVGALHATGRFLTQGKFELEELRFPYEEPDYVDEYRSAFDCPLVFGSEAMEMRFAARLLKTRLPLADEAAKKLAAKRCEEELAAIESSDDLEQRIRVQLLKMGRLHPNLDHLAKSLGLSPRTVRRRLRNAGTSYKAILNGVREELAVQYLRTTHWTIYQIAERLGYSDQSNFGRAFKSWTGQSPQEYRDAL